MLLSYPDYSEISIIHAKARNMYLRRVIIIKWEVYYLLITQLNPRLINYTTKVRKLLSIVETLKIILYHYIGVLYLKYKPHLTNENLTMDTEL